MLVAIFFWGNALSLFILSSFNKSKVSCEPALVKTITSSPTIASSNIFDILAFTSFKSGFPVLVVFIIKDLTAIKNAISSLVLFDNSAVHIL